MKVIDLKIGGAVEAPPYLIGIKNEFISSCLCNNAILYQTFSNYARAFLIFSYLSFLSSSPLTPPLILLVIATISSLSHS